jgi:hypothetical protein
MPDVEMADISNRRPCRSREVGIDKYWKLERMRAPQPGQIGCAIAD